MILPLPFIKFKKKYINKQRHPYSVGQQQALLAPISCCSIVKILPKSCPHKWHKHRYIWLVSGVLTALGEAENHFQVLRIFLRLSSADSLACCHNLSQGQSPFPDHRSASWPLCCSDRHRRDQGALHKPCPFSSQCLCVCISLGLANFSDSSTQMFSGKPLLSIAFSLATPYSYIPCFYNYWFFFFLFFFPRRLWTRPGQSLFFDHFYSPVNVKQMKAFEWFLL